MPTFDEVEDDVLPDLGPPPAPPEEPAADTKVLDLPVSIAPSPPSPSTREPDRWRRLLRSAPVQLAALAVVATAVTIGMFSFDGEPAAAPKAPTESGRFPTLEIEGAPPVTPDQIERRMRAETEVEAVRAAGPAPRDADPDDAIRAELKAIAELGRTLADAENPTTSTTTAIDPTRRVHRKRTSRPAKRGQWFAPGGTVEVKSAKSADGPPRLALSVGERLTAKLEVGISSTHAAPVLARLTEDVRADARVVAPAGAIAKGRFQSDARRIFVSFTELILTSGERLRFEGYAVERKIPGLLATRIEAPGDGDANDLMQGGLETAKEVARSIASGSIVGRVAEGVVEGVVPEGGTERARESGFVLEVPSGRPFQIVITRSRFAMRPSSAPSASR
jgi:hypothetical protein